MKFRLHLWSILSSIFFLLVCCTSEQEKILPKKAKITESVYSSVTIQPDSLYQAYTIVAGILDKNLVEEGDLVNKGQPIIQIINTTPELNSENARLTLQLTQDNYTGNSAVLQGIQYQITAAKLTLKNDSINYFRQQNLWKEHIGSQIDYDNRKLAFELARNNLKLLKSQYDRTKNELQTQVKQAANNYKTTQISTNDFRVTSKINGKIYGLYKNPGEIVTTMQPLASLGSKDAFIIEMLVDEVDIVKLEISQKVIITLDAYSSKIFEATVSKIYQSKDERSQTFKMEAIFDNPPKVLYPGLSGEGNIIISEQENALIIPKEYLIDGTKVLTEKGLLTVKLGLQNLDKIEILEGIDEETYIIRPEE